uniref:Uncharacterized protein n=1 Tax=Aegilops tauschii subsp. strangulata TaxID=200361 RepID=A0A453MN92_AEGTS
MPSSSACHLPSFRQRQRWMNHCYYYYYLLRCYAYIAPSQYICMDALILME